MVRVLPMSAVALVVVISFGTTQSVFIPLHLLTFFLAAMVCHGELVRRRPDPRHLTAFYLAMSIGGVLGGVLNALVAPLVFDRVLEYPLALALACLALPGSTRARANAKRLLDVALPLALGALTVGLLLWLRSYVDFPQRDIGRKITLGFAGIIAFSFKDRPLRFALSVGTILLASALTTGEGRPLHQERSFFGVLRVMDVPEGPFHRLVNGSTVHGLQSLDPDERRVPLTYYHPTGPMGQVFEAFESGTASSDVAIVGLGAGSLLGYSKPGERWTVYEIDPAVGRIARDPSFFTYVSDQRADSLDIVLGDARLRLREAPAHGYGLIVLDAFSSDAIPLHLLTREALALYRSRLAQGGLISFHISNRYFDLEPVLAALAQDAGLVARIRSDMGLSPEESRVGKTTSVWVVMAAEPADLGAIADDSRWVAVRAVSGRAPWTDDYSSILENFQFTLR
jgi:hypothetical protein